MIKKLLTASLLLLVLQSHKAQAHEDHTHETISPNSALSIARDVVEQFSNVDPGLGFGQLNVTWKELSKDSSKIEVEGQGYYVVSVKNDAEQKTLYVLISTTGDVYDANFTGEFPKLN